MTAKAVTRSGVDLGHLSLEDIVRISSAEGHVRYEIPGWLDELLRAFVFGDTFTSAQAADHFIKSGMPDWPPQFHALRAGEAIGAGVEAGLIERVDDDGWRFVDGRTAA